MSRSIMNSIWYYIISIALALISLQRISAIYTPDQIPLNPSARPNIIFILTDDQDVHLDSLKYMPQVRKHLLEKGTSFTKHYCTTAVCCPSRATLWSGKAAHNTNITDVNGPYGGYPKWVAQGFNENYLPVWLQKHGYSNYYTGKLFNVHTVENYNDPYPAGFTSTAFLLDPYTYDYLNSTFQHDHEEPRSYEGQYVTDVLADKAYALLDKGAASVQEGKPFFLTVAPSAPHGNLVMKGGVGSNFSSIEFSPPIPAKRHENLFQDEKVPRTRGFNPDVASGANWVLNLPQQSEANVDYNDHYHRQRLRALQAVDEMVQGLIERLKQSNLLDNTYIIYSSDNGFHIGQHRLQPGKSCGYEEDVNIPLIVRGPGVAANYSTDIVTTHTDLAPTILDIVGAPLQDELDGRPIPLSKTALDEAQQLRTRHEHANVEYWGFAGGEGKYDRTLHQHNTYKAIRISGLAYNLYYSIWCNNEHELYDMDSDPHQLNNLLKGSLGTQSDDKDVLVAGHALSKVVSRLDALLLVLKSCKAEVCREPWAVLHPEGDVWSLAEALSSEYDDFYESGQTKVKYDFCWNGYLPEAEGPMWETHGHPFKRYGLDWEHWV